MSAHDLSSPRFRSFAATRISIANQYGHDMRRDEYHAGTPEFGHWTCTRCGANLNIRDADGVLSESRTSGLHEKCSRRR